MSTQQLYTIIDFEEYRNGRVVYTKEEMESMNESLIYSEYKTKIAHKFFNPNVFEYIRCSTTTKIYIVPNTTKTFNVKNLYLNDINPSNEFKHDPYNLYEFYNSVDADKEFQSYKFNTLRKFKLLDLTGITTAIFMDFDEGNDDIVKLMKTQYDGYYTYDAGYFTFNTGYHITFFNPSEILSSSFEIVDNETTSAKHIALVDVYDSVIYNFGISE